MKKNRIKKGLLFLLTTGTLLLLSRELIPNQQTGTKQKKGAITPQQLITNLKNKIYTGEKTSIQAINREKEKVIREIFKVSGLTITVEPDIRGKVTLIEQNAPWDQILSILLRKADLRIILEGDHLSIKKRKKSSIIILSKTTSKYTGEKGDFIFNDADLKNVILFFAKNYKLNIVMDPGICGKVTCRLIQVPWDQALDVILRRHGLAIVTIGKILKIKKF
jgi:type II secretory pathway component HofQ